MKTKKIWIDLINPSHPLFFRPIIKEFGRTYTIHITLRKRAETASLAHQFGIFGETIGKDYEEPFKKTISIATRTFLLSMKIPPFDYALALENPMSVLVAKLKKKSSILLLDNDIKYIKNMKSIQHFESKIKRKADYIIIPQACEETLKTQIDENKIRIYHGYKEDFYIADYTPKSSSKNEIPFDKYILIRPEAMASFYVEKTTSIVPALLEKCKKEDINIVYLPRDESDKKYVNDNHIFIPKTPIDGLDLIYFADAVLTGSGTMAREAAIMGKPAVSFFPNTTLLSVDQQLINEKKLFHSRDCEAIIDYIKTHKQTKIDLRASKHVKQEILTIINDILSL